MRILPFLICFFVSTSVGFPQEEPILDLDQVEVVDLTQTFSETTPRWGGFPALRREPLYTYEKDGFWTERFDHVGQYGTHLDPPAHFHAGLRTLDEIPVEEFVLPAVVINVSEKVRENPDYELSLEDLQEWENRFGKIPEKSFVINHTGWSKRWPDTALFLNRDKKGQPHTPGWSLEALRFLFEERAVTAIGHETADTDAGFRNSLDRERYVLSQNRFQVEFLAQTDRLPPRGGYVVIGVPKVAEGSGFPVRVLALIPREEKALTKS